MTPAISGGIPSPLRVSISAFRTRVWEEGRRRYRDFPWRKTRDPYSVLVSEVMLQQTQTTRVVPRYHRWLERFPTFDSLAAASLADVLKEWQGLGYNRRAISLKQAADEIAEEFGGRLPDDDALLRSLPGIGPTTAAGVRAFAFDQPTVYLDTNVRAVFLHEVFAEHDGVPDRDIVPFVKDSVLDATDAGIPPREWYYALLDYGAWLKREVANPSRRSAHHVRQPPFEGSRRQKRAQLLRLVVHREKATTEELAAELSLDASDAEDLLGRLAEEGFLAADGAAWRVSD